MASMTETCHPERSEGSHKYETLDMEILRLMPQNDIDEYFLRFSFLEGIYSIGFRDSRATIGKYMVN